MSELTDHEKESRRQEGEVPEREQVGNEARANGEVGHGVGHEVDHGDQVDSHGAEVQESELLRNELLRIQEELHQANARADELKDRFMRARADLENYRKRAGQEAERARESGLDSAVLPVLSVYDDLQRAIEAAEGADPASIVPGVQSVLATLERNLENLGIDAVGHVGETFDPDLHEALTSLPTEEAGKADTIAEVFQVGFRKGERLIRPARVVVYQN